MSADIATDGARDLFASFREPAWHGLGNVFTEEVTDSGQMLDLAGLSGWDVREHDVAALSNDGDDILPAQFVVPAKAIVATIGGVNKVLGVTGERYTTIQNEDAFSFLQSLHDGARWETAGAIRGGRLVFGSIAFDRDFVLDPSGVADVVKSYLLCHTSHDGSTALGGGVTPVRVVCQNTLNVAMGNIKQTFKLRHTANVKERMETEAALWRHANTYMDAFEVEAQALYATKATTKQYQAIVETLFPKPVEDKKGAVKKWETRQDIFSQAWNGAPNAGIKGTAWGVFNALVEANQWGRSTRNAANGAENFAAAGAGFDTPTNLFRAKALNAARSLVKA